MTKFNLKNKIMIFIMSILFISVIIAGVVFAYYEISNRGWEQNISSTNIIFKVNNHDYSVVGKNDLNLIKGEKKQLDLVVSVKSNNNDKSAVMKYNITFNLIGDSELARAVEVYNLKNGEYNFIGMLNNMENIVSYLPINTSYNYEMILVLSESSGDYYDDKDFTLDAEVESELVSSEEINSDLVIGNDKRVFVTSEDNFISEIQKEDNEGKIITFLKDITLNSDITVSKKIGIDLNGYNLTLNNDININYTISTTDNINLSEIGLVNDSLNSCSISGNGNINVTGNDCYIVSDNLNHYFDKVKINITDCMSGIVNLIDSRKENFNNTYLTGDYFPLLSGLEYYTNKGISFNYSGNIFSVNKNHFKIIIEPENTYTYDYSFTVAGTDPSSIIYGKISVRGVSEKAIALSMISEIPSVINSSLFLKTYDNTTKSNITWITDEKNDEVFNYNGVYLINGYEELSSWKNRKIEITIKVSKNGYQYSESFFRTVEIISAEKRTKLIYENPQYIFEELNQEINIKDNELNNKYLEKSELKKIKININDTQNTNDLGSCYIEKNDSGDFDTIKVVYKPQNSVSIDIEIVFSYLIDKENEASYTVSKKVIILGSSSSFELDNAENLLQAPFDNNNYVNGGDNFEYKFDVLSNVKDGAFVEYIVPTEYKKYILVNSNYENNINGNLYYLNDKCYYISKRYNCEENKYVEDENGNYIFINGNYIKIENENIYNYVSTTITILPGYAPNKDTIVNIFANLFEYNESGTKTYIKDSKNNYISYVLKFTVKGVYHNIESEILNFKVYQTLLEYYDFNNDGYIGKEEAETPWFSSETRNQSTLNLLKMPSTFIIGGKTCYYINLTGIYIDDIKGLEYFTGALGYNLSNNQIVSIDYFYNIYQLEYLNLGNNLITNIDSFSYLDNLIYLNLENNFVTNIESLRYLENISYLSVYNNKVKDFSPLINYKNISTLRIFATGSDYCRSDKTKYFMTLILINNPNVKIFYDSISINNADKFKATDTEKAMAQILYNIQSMNQIYQTLYLPTSYLFNGEIYKVSYIVPLNDYLTLIYDEVKDFYGYRIISPVTSFQIELKIKVTLGSETSFCARVMNLKLLESQEDGANIPLIETSDGVVEFAKDVVPDETLRSILFETFNHTKEGTVSINGVNYNENYIITQDEISREIKTREWNNKGIKDLTGLRYFNAGLKNCRIILSSNNFKKINGYADISELSYINGITELVLGGQLFDFSDLLRKDTEDYNNNGNRDEYILTSLKKLDVSECFNLDDKTVLESLYKVYIENKSVVIYQEDSITPWDPYSAIMDEYVNNLPSLFTFMGINEERQFFEENSYSFHIKFYNYKTIDFYINKLIYYEDFVKTETSNYFNTLVSLDNNTYITGIQYKTLIGYDTTFFANAVIKGNDERLLSYKGETSDGITYNNYNVQLQVDFNYNIKVIDVKGATQAVGIDEIFCGKSLRTYVMSALYNYLLSSNSVSTMEGLTNNTNGKFYKEKDNYYINSITLSKLTIDSFIEIDSTIFENKIYDADGDYKKGISVSGLRFLTQVKSIKFKRDGYLGSGKDLINLTSIEYQYSYFDLGTLKIALPNIKSLQTSKANNYTVLYRGNDYYLRFLPNLETLVLVDTAIYDWNGLKGLLPEYWNNKIWDSEKGSFITATDKKISEAKQNVKLKNLKIYASTNTLTNKNNNLSTSVTLINSLYKLVETNGVTPYYYIGSSTDANDSTVKFPWETLGEEKNDEDLEYDEFYQRVKDIDITITSNNVVKEVYKEDIEEISSSDIITLPYSTKNILSSVFDNTNLSSRAFAIEWYIYGIKVNQLPNIFNSELSTNVIFSQKEDILINNKNVIRLNDNSANNIQLCANSLDTDYYFVIVGTIGGGYYTSYNTYVPMENKTKVSFVYPFLIQGKDVRTNSLSVFDDYVFRYYIFNQYTDNKGGFNTNKINNATTLNINTKVESGTFLKDVYGNSIVNVLANINNLNGISKFINLSTLTVVSKNLYDISDMENLPNDKLTTITFTNNLITEIGCLTKFTNLTTLNLSNNSISDIDVFLANSESKTSLTKLDVSYNPNIKATDLHNLNDFTSLTELNINKTLCDNNFETLKLVSSQINLSLNKVTFNNGNQIQIDDDYKNALLAFISECESSSTTIGNYINSQFTHTDQTTATSTISNNGYTYTINLNSIFVNENRAKLGSYIKIPLSVISSDYANIKAVFNVNYVSNATSNISFIKITDDSDKNNIKYYNYTCDINAKNNPNYTYIEADGALWAYLISISSGSMQYGFTLKSSELKISKSYGISSLKGVNYLRFTSIDISKNNITELWDNSLDNTFINSLKISGGVLSAENLACLEGATSLTSLDLSGCYGINYNSKITLKSNIQKKLSEMLNELNNLKTLYLNNEYLFQATDSNDNKIFDGKSSKINYIKYLSSVNPIYSNANTIGIETNYFNGTSFSVNNYMQAYFYYLSSKAYYSKYKCNNEELCTISIYSNDNLKKLCNFSKSDSINRHIVPDNISALDITKDGGITYNLPKSITYYGVTYSVSWKWKVDSMASPKDIDNGVWTLSYETWKNSDTTITLIPSISGGLTLASKDISVTNIETNTDKINDYYVEISTGNYVKASEVFTSMRFADMLLSNYGVYSETLNGYVLEKTKIDSITSLNIQNKDESIGIGSIEGIQIFTNLTKLVIMKGNVLDISPLKNLSLTEFAYANSYTGDSYFITDFSPLVEGSRNTLTKFEYSTFANTHINDLSFLTAFTELNTVILYAKPANTNVMFTQYLSSSSFKYLVSVLNNNNVKIYVNTTLVNYINSDFVQTGVATSQGNIKLYKIIPTTLQSQAESILSLYSVESNLIDGYKISISKTSINENKHIINLPSFLDKGGVKYSLNYVCANSNLTFNGYRIISDKEIIINGKAYNNDDLLNYEELDSLIQSIDFSDYYISGEIDVKAEFILDLKTIRDTSLLITQIKLNDVFYDRMFTLDYSMLR